MFKGMPRLRAAAFVLASFIFFTHHNLVFGASRLCDQLLTQQIINIESSDPQRISWERLQEPFVGERPRGLAAIRLAANRDGLVIVIEGARPKRASHLAKLEFIYGAKLVFTEDFATSKEIVRGPEVALHPGDAPLLANVYRGQINPHLGYDRLHGVLNKWTEYLFARSVLPDSMPQTLRVSDISRAAPDAAEANMMYSKLQDGRYGRGDLDRWTQTVTAFFARVHEVFPQGAFIKHVGEFATKDKDAQILSWKADAAALVKDGFRQLARLHKGAGDERLTELELQEVLNSEPGAAARFMHALLRAPESILVQEKLDIELTAMGFPLEFRVDFVDGEAVRAEPRHSGEYMPEEANQAMRFLNEFFAKAPREFRHLSGGADVMFVKGGKKKFIEFNMGSESEHIDAGAGYPVMPNYYVSQLLGKPTRMIAALNDMAFRPVKEQAEYLTYLDHMLGVSRWGDFSAVSYEAFRYMRDLRLEAWRKNPTQAAARVILRDLNQLEKKLDNDDGVLRGYINEARSFFKKWLKK